MKKSELKTGMVVELRNRDRYQVLLNTPHGDILQGAREDTEWSSHVNLDDYEEDLILSKNLNYNILRIWGTSCESARAFSAPFEEFTRLLWERPEEVREIDSHTAIDMLEKALGCKVKITR